MMSRQSLDLTIDNDDNPWPAIRKNYIYLSNRLHFNALFLGHLLQERFLSQDDYEDLRGNDLNREEKTNRLLLEILPSKPPAMFSTFCEILNTVGQSHLADRLLDTDSSTPCHGQLSSQGTSVHWGKTSGQDLVESLATIDLWKERSERAEKEANEAKTKLAKVETELAKVAAKMQELQCVNDALRNPIVSNWRPLQASDADLMWTLCKNEVPSALQLGTVAESEDKVVINGTLDGTDSKLHVFTKEGQLCNTFVRDNGEIWRVTSHRDTCLVLVRDSLKNQFVIEEFCMSNEKKWRHITTLPDELQISCVSIALQDNLLYAVAGMIRGERVNTARVFDLQTGCWYTLENLMTKRSGCSIVVLNDTVYVGAGWTDNRLPCDSIECLRKGSRHWETFASVPTQMCTLTAFGNKLMSTGGEDDSYSYSNGVKWFDGRLREWLSLPSMIRKRSWHGLLSTEDGKIFAAGGEKVVAGEEMVPARIQSMEFANFK